MGGSGDRWRRQGAYRRAGQGRPPVQIQEKHVPLEETAHPGLIFLIIEVHGTHGAIPSSISKGSMTNCSFCVIVMPGMPATASGSARMASSRLLPDADEPRQAALLQQDQNDILRPQLHRRRVQAPFRFTTGENDGLGLTAVGQNLAVGPQPGPHAVGQCHDVLGQRQGIGFIALPDGGDFLVHHGLDHRSLAGA